MCVGLESEDDCNNDDYCQWIAAGGGDCQDSQGWDDGDGNGCEWYLDQGSESYGGEDNNSPELNCCACGKGVSAADETDDESAPTECEDTPEGDDDTGSSDGANSSGSGRDSATGATDTACIKVSYYSD